MLFVPVWVTCEYQCHLPERGTLQAIADRLEEMATHEDVKEKKEEKLKNDYRETVELPSKYKTHHLAFLQMPQEFERI